MMRYATLVNAKGRVYEKQNHAPLLIAPLTIRQNYGKWEAAITHYPDGTPVEWGWRGPRWVPCEYEH